MKDYGLRATGACRFVGLALLLATTGASAQDSVTVVADPDLGRGGLRRALLGDHYRDLWTTPVRVARLDLAREGGGLTPTRRGGGLQTRSLRFSGGDGKQYVFRALEKDPTRVLPEELRETFAADILRDQMSAMHPGAPLVVPPILAAVGVLHVVPRLVVMPDDPRLGEFRAEFGNNVGTIEERPGDGDDDTPGFAGARKLLDTPELIEELRDKPWVRVDAKAFLTARLVDLYLGDWDRHEDQWRWALVGTEDTERYLPIPRDRDQAFARYDGLFLDLQRMVTPQLLDYGRDYADPEAATWNGRNLDRRLLVEPDWEAWDDAARAIQAAVTDAVITDALSRLPPEYRERDGARMRDAMIHRRDGLRQAAERTYKFLARQVRLEAGDKDDVAVVNRLADGSTEITLSRRNGEQYFHRAFDQRETEDISLDLRGGDDRLIIRGEGKGPLLRVVGGAGADTLADSSAARNSRFYDIGDATVTSGRKVDRRPYVQPADTNSTALPERDWGSHVLGAPSFYVSSDLGLTIGYLWTRRGYGFRRQPWASSIGVSGAWAFGRSSGRLAMNNRWKRTNRSNYVTVDAIGSGIETLQFYGFGNNTVADESTRFYQVRASEFGLGVGLGWGLEGRNRFRIGVRGQHSITDLDNQPEATAPIVVQQPYGVGDFGYAGLAASWEWDTRDLPQLPTRGARIVLDAGAYPLTWANGDGGFGTANLAAAGFVSPGEQTAFTLAFRAGGRIAMGAYPWFEAAYLGGVRSLRGFPANRFAGDASLYGSAEVRLRIARTFIVVPGELGIFGLTDLGRVFADVDDDLPDTTDLTTWHSDFGGGLYYGVLSRSLVVAAGFAGGKEGSRFYFGLGLGQ